MILIVDDDRKLRDLLAEFLQGYGYGVRALPDGEDLLPLLARGGVDLVVLDVMMPGKDGFELLHEMRREHRVPVVMLTAKGEDTDRIVGLEMGADDYLPKPFNPRELLARIKAVLRRCEAGAEAEPDGGELAAGGLRLDVGRQLLQVGAEVVELSSTEFRLLRALMERPNVTLSRERLMNLVWGKDFSAYDRSIDVHISKLRGKLEKQPGHEKRIKTVWGTGYMFIDP